MGRSCIALSFNLPITLCLLSKLVFTVGVHGDVLINNIQSNRNIVDAVRPSHGVTSKVNGLTAAGGRPHNTGSGIVQNLTLELSNSSPAVLDSAVVFHAKLRDYSGGPVDSDKYKYVWHDYAKADDKITWDKFSSSITRVYRGDQYTAGMYTMMVRVYKDRELVAVETMDYSLTGRLNGNMTVQQDLSYQREKNVLSTDQPLTLIAQVHDKFHSPSQEVEYHWYLNGQAIGASNKPELNVSLADPGPKRIAVHIKAKIISDVFILPRYVNKTGFFAQFVTLKNPLDRLRIKGGEAVPMNSLFYLNVSCEGSGPTSICWYVSPIPMTGEGGNITCSPTIFQDTCNHLVNLSIPNPGKYRFKAMLLNDVSQLEKQWYLYVYDPGSANVPAITVPVVFGVLAIVIIVIGGAYIMKLRKKPYVEVADFDFHPSLTEEVENSKLSVKIRRTVRSLLLTPNFVSTPRPAKSTFTVYGSVEEDNGGL